MIKCLNCNSNKVCLKFKEHKYTIVNECFNCYNIYYLFIDDYFLNYKEFYSYTDNKENVSKSYNCSKHSKTFILFCHNCNELLCEECLLSHDSTNHSIQKINEIIDEKEMKEINEYNKELINLKSIIEEKIGELNNGKEEFTKEIKILNSLLYIINIKCIYLDSKIQNNIINAYDLISLKYFINKHNKIKLNILTKEIQNGKFPTKNDIDEYNKNIYYSFKSTTKEKIINKKIHNWVNHAIQLQNGNILSSTWDSLYLYKINHQTNTLDLILTIHVNNGSINHMYEYKKNKILCCDNQMKILQLNKENTSYKILYVVDYGRKIISFKPFINEEYIELSHCFLLTATPNGIKTYYYIDDKNDIIDNQLDEVANDINYLGDFSKECDYSSIIQVKNKICGIYTNKNSRSSNNFSVWEINYDFNIKNFSKDKFNFLGEIKNVGAGIGRYSITNINDEYALIGTMGNYYYYPNTDSLTNGIKVVSLEHIEIIQYIYTGDEIMTINSLKNGMILTGGVNVNQGNRKYYIRQFRYDEKEKEIFLVGSIQLHTEFINSINDIKDGVFMSCSRDGNIFLIYN